MSDFTLPALDARAALADPRPLIDVRKAPARAADGHGIADATWIDPYALDHDATLLNRPGLVFFCVHGHEVSQFACALALMHGVEAAYVTGGYAALTAAGAEREALA